MNADVLTTRESSPDAPAPGRPYLALPATDEHTLVVVVYHYVGDQEQSRFPRINALPLEDFRHQLRTLAARYEMATLDSALRFLDGRYRPARSLCLLTFDDGLKGHHRDVVAELAAAGVQGIFFATTGCIEGGMAAVHKNHCLMAALDFTTYQRELMTRLEALGPGLSVATDEARASRAYPWDPPEVAAFKYLLNYGLPVDVRSQVLDAVFADFIGAEKEVARHFYMDWDELRDLQARGMLIGGHTHGHMPLTSLDAPSLRDELETCHSLLHGHLAAQAHWPFSYPYGYCDEPTARAVGACGFDCSFALDGGGNRVDQDVFRIRRVDTKDLVFQLDT
jgi:peptidoglycan/xylan/chitin deacetylase (PgdA/CDA1 family)